MSVWISVTRSLVYPTGQSSGTYSRQLLPWRPSDVEGSGLLSSGWHLVLSWWCGILTPSWSPSRNIPSASGHGCPHTGFIVRPSAWLPARSTHLLPHLASRCALPCVSATRAMALSRTLLLEGRKMRLLGKTASSIKSPKACDWNEIYVYVCNFQSFIRVGKWKAKSKMVNWSQAPWNGSLFEVSIAPKVSELTFMNYLFKWLSKSLMPVIFLPFIKKNFENPIFIFAVFTMV